MASSFSDNKIRTNLDKLMSIWNASRCAFFSKSGGSETPVGRTFCEVGLRLFAITMGRTITNLY